MADERIPAQRRVELYVVPNVPLLARHPCEYHHYPLYFPNPFPSSPIIPTPKSPHFNPSLFFQEFEFLEYVSRFSETGLYKIWDFTRIPGKDRPFLNQMNLNPWRGERCRETETETLGRVYIYIEER